MKKFIISGGSGLVGKRLCELLIQRGDSISLLSRNNQSHLIKKYVWDIEKSKIDLVWLNETDTIIHLAGAGVADKKWTASYKKEIYDSRINSTKLLFETLKNNPHTVKTIVAASAIGIYGNELKDIVDESSPSANTFLAKVCKDWENEVLKFETIGIRVVILRTGIVLSKTGGFISEISKPIKMLLGSVFGNGKQLMSWIHIDDLCRMYIKAAEDENMSGIFNAVAPNPVSNSEVTKKIAVRLHKLLILPNIPAFVLTLVFGEMAGMLISDQNVSCKKIQTSGFDFKYSFIDSALEDLIE
jgi:uncharacterized protein